jgi:AcrR family transcriptional regulator
MTHSTRVGRQIILEAAERLFMERGFRAVSIREIAKACGVTNAALYYYFPDKETLFAEVMQNHAARIGERMEQARLSVTAPQDQVQAIIREYARSMLGSNSPFFLAQKNIASIKRARQPEQVAAVMQSMFAPLFTALTAARNAGTLRKTPSPHEAAAILISMLHGLAQYRHMTNNNAGLTDNDSRQIVEMFWKGMLK